MVFTEPLCYNGAFLRAYRRGKSVVTKYFVLYLLKTKHPQNRLGITASKKIGNAVQRNRARRVLKESYRRLEGQLCAGYDVVLVSRKKILSENQRKIEARLSEELKNLDIWKKAE